MPVPAEIPEKVEQSTTSSTSTTSATNATVTQKLLSIINSSHLRFGWFLGNVAVIFNALFYILTFRSRALFHSFWYRLVFFGAIDAFGIVLYQNKRKFYSNAGGAMNIQTVLQDDNTHYLYNALVWLLIPKQYFLAIVPFLSFSIFHVANFVGNDVLPVLGIFAGVSSALKSFTARYHESSRRVAAGAELLLLVQLITKALVWRKYSWISLVLYSLFIKLKSESSVFTKTILKNWEVRVDGLVSLESVPPSVKSYWIAIKRAVKKVGKYSITRREEVATKAN